MKADSAGAVFEQAVVPALHVIVYNLTVPDSPDLASLFEAKGGLRPALLTPKNGSDPMGEISKQAYITKGIKDLSVHLASHQTWAVWQMKEAPQKKGDEISPQRLRTVRVLENVTAPGAGVVRPDLRAPALRHVQRICQGWHDSFLLHGGSCLVQRRGNCHRLADRKNPWPFFEGEAQARVHVALRPDHCDVGSRWLLREA